VNRSPQHVALAEGADSNSAIVGVAAVGRITCVLLRDGVRVSEVEVPFDDCSDRVGVRGLSARPGEMDVLGRSMDGLITRAVVTQAADNVIQVSPWQALDGATFPDGCTVAAVCTRPGDRDIIAVDSDGQMRCNGWTFSESASGSAEEWLGWTPLEGRTFSHLADIAAVSPRFTGDASIFTVDEGICWNNYWPDPPLRTGQWSGWYSLPDPPTSLATDIAATSAGTDNSITVYGIALDGSILRSRTRAANSRARWETWTRISEAALPPFVSLSAVATASGDALVALSDLGSVWLLDGSLGDGHAAWTCLSTSEGGHAEGVAISRFGGGRWISAGRYADGVSMFAPPWPQSRLWRSGATDQTTSDLLRSALTPGRADEGIVL
jgi:hypothetical protein